MENQTTEESTVSNTTSTTIVRHYNAPLAQNISTASTSFAPNSSLSSLSRVPDYSQAPPIYVPTRPVLRDFHLTPYVNIPPWLHMDNRRESQTEGESTVNNTPTVFRPYMYDVPLSQDISAPSTCFVSSSSSASLSRAADYPLSPFMNFLTRPDCVDLQSMPGVNIPPRLNMRESQTVGESTVNNTPTVFRPYDVPLSQDISAPSTCFVSSSSSASLSRAADYPPSPFMNFLTRPDCVDLQSTPGMNIPPWLNMRESQRVGESTVNNTPTVFRPYDVPLSQDISALSTCFVSSISSASLSRAAGYHQSPAMDVFTRPDFRGSHLTPGVNIPPWLPMDNRRESQTVGESTVNSSTALFRPCNLPAMPAFPSSRLTHAQWYSSLPVPSNLSSLSRIGYYSQSPTIESLNKPDFTDVIKNNEVRIRIYILQFCPIFIDSCLMEGVIYRLRNDRM